MVRSLRTEYPGAFYHVTSGGNERKEVFRSGQDREQLLAYLESTATRYGAHVSVYCLLSNVNLLVETRRGNPSQIVAHVIGTYTTQYAAKHAVPGGSEIGWLSGVQPVWAEDRKRQILIRLRSGRQASAERR